MSRLGSPRMYFGKSCYYDTAGRLPGILLVDEILLRPHRRAARAALLRTSAGRPAASSHFVADGILPRPLRCAGSPFSSIAHICRPAARAAGIWLADGMFWPGSIPSALF
jgi:hypothetical protein